MNSWTKLLIVMVLFLCGCAADRLFSEGKDLVDSGFLQEGFASVEKAIAMDPANPEYRLFLKTRQEALIPSLLAYADENLARDSLDGAEVNYRQILSIDPKNQPALMGIEKVVVIRRHQRLLKDAESLFKKENFDGAAEIVHEILTENPQNRAARDLGARVSEWQLRKNKPETALSERFRSPVSLEFRDAPLHSVFEIVAKVSGINFVYDKDIRPDLKVTLHVKDSSIEETILLISVTNQLEFRVLNENSILIYPNTPQKVREYQPLVVRSFYLSNADAKQVSASLKTLLKTKDLVVNEKLNLIIMRDTVDAVRLAERIIALEDLNEPEVMLEVEVLEVKRSRILSLGIKWPDSLTLATPGDMLWSQFRRLTSDSITTNMTNMVISARKTDSDVKILANPRIRVKNREKAKILIGDRVPVVTTTSTATGFVADSVNYVDVGLKFEVEPNIYLDDEISMRVQLEVSSIVKEVVSRSGTLSYQIGTRNANTVLRLRDGETQILAGLINNEDRNTAQKVPGLGDLPVLGRLFSQQNDDSQKTEIVLSITPRLVRTIRRPDLLNAEFDSGTEAALSSRPITKPSTGEKKRLEKVHVVEKTPDSEKTLAGEAERGISLDALKNAATAEYKGNIFLDWKGPSEVNAGERFSVVLGVVSEVGMMGLTASMGYDPEYVQFIGLEGGGFLESENPDARLSNRVDFVMGKIFLSTSGVNKPARGRGALMTANFRALQAVDKTRIQIFSVTPEIADGKSVSVMPADLSLSIR
ncbi:MAG: general secretion pathway protein GspD [Candidatus Accumulibacter sp.]|jgi:general secretion pathway protein D|nr:general secretion pathway protein GspD [Accumulibacter sp.]